MNNHAELTCLDSLPLGFFQIDGENRIMIWNRWMEKYTGYSKKDVQGCRLEAFYPGQKTLFKILERARQGRQPVILSQLLHSYFLPIRLGDNHLSGFQMMQQDCHIVPQNESGGSLAITIQDVTSHVVGRRRIKNMHVDLKETRQAALDSAKEKAETLAMMSHEIRTPLNAVIGFTDILLESSLDPMQLDYLKIIQKSGDRLLRLLSDILSFSKLEANRIELHTPFFNLRECIEETSRLVEKMASDKGLNYSWKTASPLPREVKTDNGRLTQVLLNLFSNSVKFTEKGTVQLVVKSKKLEAGSAELLFSISDTGPGIPQNRRNRLFKPFSQVDSQIWERHGGTGLGLAISKKLVELMGGKIWLDEECHTGTTFHFTLPVNIRQEDTFNGGANLNGSNGKEPVKALSILLVEDHPLNRKLTAAQLKKLGHRSSFAQDGRECLQLLKRENFDLILMNLQMPVMDGYEAARRIRQLPIIAISADASRLAQERCMIAGINDFYTKPITINDLKIALQRWHTEPRQENPAQPAHEIEPKRIAS